MRKVVVALVILFGLVGLAAFAVFNFDGYLQDNREWLAQQASDALGRPVAFDEVGVSFRGGLGARIGSLSVGDDPAFSKESFLQVGRADVVVKILPALRGRYELDRVVLDSPRVNVIRDSSGFNFDSIGQSGDGEPAAGASSPSGGGSASGSEALPFLVSMLEIRDGHFGFTDRTVTPASELAVEQLDFSASDVGFDSPVSIDLAMAVLGFSEQNVKVTGTVGPVGSPENAARSPLDLDVDLGPLIIDRAKTLPVIGGSVPAELSSPDPMSLHLDVTGKADAPVVQMTFDASDAKIGYGDAFHKPKGVRFAIDAEVAQGTDRIDVSAFVFRIAEATLTGGGWIGLGSSSPIDFEIKGAGVPLAGWGRLVSAAEGVDVDGAVNIDIRATGETAAGAPTLRGSVELMGVRAVQPGGGLEISDLSTRIALNGDQVEIPPTQLKVGGEPATLSATVSSLRNLAADISLSAAKIRLAAVGAAGEGVQEDEFLGGLEVKAALRSASGRPQVRASVSSSEGSLRDVAFSKLNADIGLVGDVASLKKLSVKAFDGLVTGIGSYDMSNADQPAFGFRGRVSGVDVAEVTEYLDIASTLRMTGRVNGDIVLDGRGTDAEQIMQSLAGDGSLQVGDGVLKGVNIAEQALTSITGIPGLSQLVGAKIRKKYSELFSDSDTVFDALGGEMSIAEGAVNLRGLVLEAKDYGMRGDGKVGFDSKVDIQTMFVASRGLTEDLLGSVREATYLVDANGRFELPLKLTGKLPEIGVRPDSDFVAKKLSKALVSSGIEKGLGAILGKKRSKDGADPAEPGERDAQPDGDGKEPGDETERLIRKGLEGLFGVR